jgi:hypothetical protein
MKAPELLGCAYTFDLVSLIDRILDVQPLSSESCSDSAITWLVAIKYFISFSRHVSFK